MSDTDVIKRLEKVGHDVFNQFKSEKVPAINIPMRTLSNVYFDTQAQLIKLGNKTQERSYFNINQTKKFMQTILMAGQIKDLMKQKKPALDTRQLFYILRGTIPGTNEDVFSEQVESDSIIEDVEVATDSLREQLKLVAVPKGIMAGPIEVEDVHTGDILDYTKMGTAGGAIPPIVEEEAFKIKSCTAKYILVVEKYAVWNLLNQERYWKNNNCLLITGKGQPARAERRLVSRLAKELKLPVYIFCDMDVYGYYIYSVYKQGSINLAFFSEKAATPSAKYLGFCVDDFKRFDLPKSTLMKMTKGDLKRISEVQNYDWFKNKDWQGELKKLKDFGYKIESDSLVTKSIEFTAKEYLPTKIENKMFLN